MRIVALLGISSAVHAGAFAAYGYLNPPEPVPSSAGTAIAVQLLQLPLDLAGLSIEPASNEPEPIESGSIESVSIEQVSIDLGSISERQPELLPARLKQTARVPEEQPAVRVVTTRSEQAKTRMSLTEIAVVKGDASLAPEPEALQLRTPANSQPGLMAIAAVLVLPIAPVKTLSSNPDPITPTVVQELTVSTFQPSLPDAALDVAPVLASLNAVLPAIDSERISFIPASSVDQSPSVQNASGNSFPGDHPSQNLIASASLEQQAGQQLLRALDRYFRYPLKARRKGWQGEVVLRVQLSERGVVRDVLLLQSSGYKALDRAALKSMNQVQAIQQLALNGELSVEVPISYRLLN